MFHGDSTTEAGELMERLYHPLLCQQASGQNNSVTPYAKEKQRQFKQIIQNHSVHIPGMFL